MVQFFYRLDTFQIDAVFVGCKTESPVWKDPAAYREVNVEHPPYFISRDHKVVLDLFGNVVDTTPSPNPVQPTPTPSPNADIIQALRDKWPTLTTPEKIELVKTALTRLLG